MKIKELQKLPKKELIKLIKDYKKLAEINFKGLNNKYKILKSLSTNDNIDRDFKKTITIITQKIIAEKFKKPKFWYKFPKRKLTKEDIAKWCEVIENFYYFAKEYEEQERGRSCSVDRAYRDWLIPKCNELLNKIKKLGIE